MLAFSVFIMGLHTAALQPDILFHTVTVSSGLNDGTVMSLAQDKFGYIWIGTLGGLNRFNGNTAERFTHQFGDSNSAPSTIPYSITSDADGRLWAGTDYGLYEFNFVQNNFSKLPVLPNVFIAKIIAAPDHQLLIQSSGTIYSYNTRSRTLTNLQQKNAGLKNYALNCLFLKGNHLYIGTTGGYIDYDMQTNAFHFQPVQALQQLNVSKLMVEANGTVWLSNKAQSLLIRYNPGKDSVIISDYPEIKRLNKKATYNDFATDTAGNVWIATSAQGLLKYETATGKLSFYLLEQDNGVYTATSFLSCIMASADGSIWVGKNGGCIYFSTAPNRFGVVRPFPVNDKNQFGRAVRQDKDGNLWFGTVYGVSRFDSRSNQYTFWRNEPGKENVIYNNSVRGIETGNDGRIWIATGCGINAYDPLRNKMQFFSERDGAPKLFYYSANRDSKGRIWFGTNQGDGLYYFKESDNKFYSIVSIPLLKQFKGMPVRIVFEDSKKRLWIGSGAGLVMADEQTETVRYWYNKDTTRNTVIGNIINDIKEDKKGWIWVSSFNGVTGIEPTADQYQWIDEKMGLKTNVTTSLRVDALNRLWIGTASGLYMLDSTRKQLDYFDEAAGMVSAEFTEHPGYQLTDGTFMMPSIKGFVTFNAAAFQPQHKTLSFYAARITAGNKNVVINKQASQELNFSATENSFTIYLEALNFDNPVQTWYAYKLEGFDNDWHYTNDPKAVYTNVPGGNYTFLYKAAYQNVFDNVKHKLISLHIQKHFYKTVWFWMLLVLIIAASLYALYRFRIHKQEQIFLLERKAEKLEKEKTQVQYDSLKQQLNPHFLFNSLTSLRSLIKTDPKTAATFLDGLSTVYRYILKSGNQELVTLQAELEFVQTFTALQKTRFGDGIEVQTQVDAALLQKYIAPVTLQNLVENAIKHNTTGEDSPLVITILTEGEYVLVKNNLQRYQYVETSNKRGLENLKTLYKYYSEKPVEILVDDQYFTIKIPLL